MAKVALIVGVSEYAPGLNPLPQAIKDAERVRAVLLRADIGQFDKPDVNLLLNPSRQSMEEAIEQLFTGREKDDLLLLYFSGHGIKDDLGILYLSTSKTRKGLRGELVRSTAVSSRFIHESMERSRSKRQVVILDCCFSGAFAEGLSAKDDGVVDIRTQLGGIGRAVLTSSTSTQYSFGQENSLSVYTQYLIEGLETGEADQDRDEFVSIDELHDYASRKVRESQPGMQPEIFAIKEGFKIRLAKVPPGDLLKKYRKEVEKSTNGGNLSFAGRRVLNVLRSRLGLSIDEAEAIEHEVLEPYRKEFGEKLTQYEQVFRDILWRDEALGDTTRKDLQNLQQILGLKNEHTWPIESSVTTEITTYRRNLKIYEQDFCQATKRNYPLTEKSRLHLQQLQVQFKLQQEDVLSIERRVTEQVEAYREKLRQYEQVCYELTRRECPLSESLRQLLQHKKLELSLLNEDAVLIETRVTSKVENYLKSLEQYEHEFSSVVQRECPVGILSRDRLNQIQQHLELDKKDVLAIEQRLIERVEAQRERLREYERVFYAATQREYPLGKVGWEGLKQRQAELSLTEEEVSSIEAQITAQIESYRRNFQQYEHEFSLAMHQEYPLRNETLERLSMLRQMLDLQESDTLSVETRIANQVADYHRRVQNYEQAFVNATQLEYPLSDLKRADLRNLQQSLGLVDDVIDRIETGIIKKVEEYRQNIRSYEEALLEAVQYDSFIDSETCEELKRLQILLGLSDNDVAVIEERVTSLRRGIYTVQSEPNSSNSEVSAEFLTSEVKKHLEKDLTSSNSTSESVCNGEENPEAKILSRKNGGNNRFQFSRLLKEPMELEPSLSAKSGEDSVESSSSVINPRQTLLTVQGTDSLGEWRQLQLLGGFFKRLSSRNRILLGVGVAILASGFLAYGYVRYSQQQAKILVEEKLNQIRLLKDNKQFNDCINLSRSNLASNTSIGQELLGLLSDCQLSQAQELAESGSFVNAINVLLDVTQERSIYDQAAQLIKDWSEQIMSIAKERYQAGKFDEASSMLLAIPESSPSHQNAETQLKQWQFEWQTDEKHVQDAQKALDNKKWQAALDEAEKVSHPFWKEKVQTIVSRAKAAIQLAKPKPISAPSPQPTSRIRTRVNPSPSPKGRPSNNTGSGLRRHNIPSPPPTGPIVPQSNNSTSN